MQFTRNVQSIVIKCNCTLFFKTNDTKVHIYTIISGMEGSKTLFFQHKILMQIHVF